MLRFYHTYIDESIRQVTISCQERGLLLLRVRDEIRMSIAAYQTLYESSIAFGMRKALQAEEGKSEMEQKIHDLEEEMRMAGISVLELKAKCESIEKREGERRAMEERKHGEEIGFLKKTNVQLKVAIAKNRLSSRVSCRHRRSSKLNNKIFCLSCNRSRRTRISSRTSTRSHKRRICKEKGMEDGKGICIST